MDDRSYETPNRAKRARELRIEPRLGLGSPRRESSPRAREGNCLCAGGLRARGQGPWPPISADGERRWLAFYI